MNVSSSVPGPDFFIQIQIIGKNLSGLMIHPYFEFVWLVKKKSDAIKKLNTQGSKY